MKPRIFILKGSILEREGSVPMNWPPIIEEANNHGVAQRSDLKVRQDFNSNHYLVHNRAQLGFQQALLLAFLVLFRAFPRKP